MLSARDIFTNNCTQVFWAGKPPGPQYAFCAQYHRIDSKQNYSNLEVLVRRCFQELMGFQNCSPKRKAVRRKSWNGIGKVSTSSERPLIARTLVRAQRRRMAAFFRRHRERGISILANLGVSKARMLSSPRQKSTFLSTTGAAGARRKMQTIAAPFAAQLFATYALV